MKIENNRTKTQRVELNEKDIESILRLHMVEQFGADWEYANYSLWQQSVVPYMGQIDDETETKVSFKLVTEEF